MHLIEKLFGADAPAPPNAVKLDGTTETILTHSLSVLSPDERGWVTFAEARILFSTKDAQYAFGETDQNGARVKSVLAQPTGISVVIEGSGLLEFRGKTRTFKRVAESGNLVEYDFCPGCGPVISWHVAALQGREVFAGGAIDDPGALEMAGEMYTAKALPREFNTWVISMRLATVRQVAIAVAYIAAKGQSNWIRHGKVFPVFWRCKPWLACL